MDDSKAVLRAIRRTPDDKPIDLIIHTPGGLVLPATQIALALNDHQAKTRILTPHYAMSGGTLLALACDDILMDPHAVLVPVDQQIQRGEGVLLLPPVYSLQPRRRQGSRRRNSKELA